MASSIASQDYLGDGSSLEGLEIHIPKLTAIDKIGGIFCHICDSIFGNKKDFDSHYAQHTGTEIVYTCVACKKQISGYPSFRGHCYLNHVVKNKFQCKHCSKKFCKLSILNSHITAVHEYKCISCDEKFTSKKDLENHKNNKHAQIEKGKDAPPYECLDCGTIIKTVDFCQNHIDDHSEMLYPCPICEVVLPNKLAAVKHLTIHFNEIVPTEISPTSCIGEDSSIQILGGILCCHCDLLFPNRAEIDDHFSVEHEGKIILYSCNICNKQYEKYDLFGKHCYDHFARDKFQCDQCNKTFDRLSRLVIHTELFHTGCALDKPYTCQQCNHGFKTNLRLQEHMRIVHEESEVKIRCTKPGCTSTFPTARELIHHLKAHSPELDNWCRQCGLQFAGLASAERHLDVHRRKQYTCPVCRRAYREKHLMAKHVPVHFESVVHVCKMCGKAYGARSRLLQHIRSHSDDRAYKCTFCSKSFMKPHELQQHLNIHTGRRPYACSLCSRSFASEPNWSKHLQRMHGLSKPEVKRLRAPPPPADPAAPAPAFVEADDNYAAVDVDPQVHSIQDPMSGEFMSITDTVNAVIDRIDSLDDDLDAIAGKVDIPNFVSKYNTVTNFNGLSSAVDDSSDIRAIVEDIDAMSGEMEAANRAESVPGQGLDDVGSEVLQYTNMMPVDNVALNIISDPATSHLSELPYPPQAGWQPEVGPDFLSQDGTLDDHLLPHIDPLLTIKAEDNAKMYVQNFNFDTVAVPIEYNTPNAWEPSILTKVFEYDENNEANRMYIY